MKYTIKLLRRFENQLNSKVLTSEDWPDEYKNILFLKELISNTGVSIYNIPYSIITKLLIIHVILTNPQKAIRFLFLYSKYEPAFYDAFVKSFKTNKNAFILYSLLPLQYKYGELQLLAELSYHNSPDKKYYNFDSSKITSLFDKRKIQLIYYHTTRILNLKSIFKYGLNPSRISKRNYDISRAGVIYLSVEPSIYEWMPNKLIGNVDIVVLTIKSNGLNPNKFFSDENYDTYGGSKKYILYHGVIPRKNIVHIKPYITKKLFPVPTYINIGINQFKESIFTLDNLNHINLTVPIVTHKEKQSSVSIAINLNVLKLDNPNISIRLNIADGYNIKQSNVSDELITTYNNRRVIPNIFINKAMAIRLLEGGLELYNKIIQLLKRRHIKFRLE